MEPIALPVCRYGFLFFLCQRFGPLRRTRREARAILYSHAGPDITSTVMNKKFGDYTYQLKDGKEMVEGEHYRLSYYRKKSIQANAASILWSRKGVGAGPISPVASNKTEEGRAENRRVELVEQ